MDSKTGPLPFLEEDIVKLQKGMISAIEKNDPKIKQTPSTDILYFKGANDESLEIHPELSKVAEYFNRCHFEQ